MIAIRHLVIAMCCVLAACPAPPDTSPEVGPPDIDVATDGQPEVAFDAGEVDSDIEVTPPECAPGDSAACDDDNPCTDDACRPSATCAHTPNIALCDDGDACTAFDRCTGGVCVGSGFDCDDGLPCTNDVCVDGGCAHVPVVGACDDGSLCTEGEVCVGGECVGTPVSCPNGPCGSSTCEPRTGCVIVAIGDGAACDDGDACTLDTTCVGGVCRGQIAVCDDGDVCTDDYCDATSGCVARPNHAPCDDDDACTHADQCSDGICGGTGSCCVDAAACDDGDPCTDDACQGVCINLPMSCDDGDPCTRDTCELGQCGSTAWALSDDGQTIDDFEDALANWAISSSNADVTWRIATTWAASGEASLYCGDEAGAGYDHGATRASALTRILVPPGDPELHLVVRLDVPSASCVYDALTVRVEGDELDVICGPGEREVRLSLAGYEGREVDLELVFDTVDDIDNGGAGVWVDRLQIRANGCVPL